MYTTSFYLTLYLSLFFRLKTFNLALHPPLFFFRLKTFSVSVCGVSDMVDMIGLGATTVGPCNVLQKRA